MLSYLLSGLSKPWTHNNESGESWSAFDVIGHLIYGEKTDWIPRIEIIMKGNESGKFQPFDRFAQFENSKGKRLEELLGEFHQLRKIV